MITQERLKELFDYDPITGFLTRKTTVRYNARAGCVVNYIDSVGYVGVSVDGRKHRAHRLIWIYVHGEVQSGCEIDHINHDRSDNRLKNLRCVSRQDNVVNKRLRVNNKSGINGVWMSKKGKWCAQISRRGVRKSLAMNTDFFEACCARKSAEAALGFHRNHGGL